ncbi:UrvD/REP family ATP-dependent DNA helicase, partial [Demequina sp.]|uniref:UrvD/REP family ATP-dependent DNA helicase n=1 Tax=Demequina sp. TaxID=2050685 RepID=UPI0025F6FCE3
ATVAWAVWGALGVADGWRAAALAGSARDDADLDAVVALMRAAQVYVERMPSASVESFIDHLEGQDFAADSLGARARLLDAVSFCTPASAAGREWDVVVVAGLEEGVWPDTRLRDAVLGAQHLAEILAGRADAVPLPEHARAQWARSTRRAVLDDETRAFAVAVSRARRRLILTCVDGEDSRPARFVTWVAEAAGVTPTQADSARRVSDLRSAVAAVRAAAAPATGEARAAHVEVLARLARRRVAGAHPAAWHGVAPPSSDVGMWEPDQQVRVSPSRLESLEACPLRWALETVGGTAASTDKQSLGTLVHEIAAELPAGTHAQLAAALDERWADIAGTDTWPDRVMRERADAMVRRLAAYVAGVGAAEVRVEQPFAVAIGRAVVAGSADRVEISDGAARIVDLKTGAPVSKAKAEDHAQLAMYQLAADHGGFAGVSGATGAALVFVGGDTQGASERAQPAIDVDRQRQRLADAVETMAGATFEAITNDRCGSCPVRRSCPAWPSGRQVTDS